MRDCRVYQGLLIGRPGIEPQAKVVEATTDRHHHITSGVFPQPNGIFHNPAALNRANDMLYSYTAMGNQPVLGFLLLGQLLAARLFVRLCDLNTFEREADKTKVLQQFSTFWQRIGCLISNWLVVGAALIGVTQERNATASISKQDVFHCMTLFLAAITRFLLKVILGAGDWSFGAIVKKRGASFPSLERTSAKRTRSA